MIQCVICGQQVTSKRGLAFHIKKHGIQSIKDYVTMFPEEEQNVDPKNSALLVCPLCGKKNLKQLTQHLTWKHNMTREKFEKLYPEQTLFIPEISDRCRRATQIGHEVYLKNFENDPEKYKKSYKERSIKRTKNNPDIGIKIATILRRNGVYEKTSERSKRMWESTEYRKMQSEKCKRQHENGLTEIVIKKSLNRNHVKVASINNVLYRFRSSYELDFALLLDSLGIKFEYESIKINYFYNGKIHVYYPDFYIPDTNIVFEVKPYFRIQDIRNQCKQRACVESGYSFRYITEYELENPKNINLTGCF